MNEQIFKDYIAASKLEMLSVEWVNWMLDTLSKLNKTGASLNPEWLKASGRFPNDTEPRVMGYVK